jgi:hypothetical protein
MVIVVRHTAYTQRYEHTHSFNHAWSNDQLSSRGKVSGFYRSNVFFFFLHGNYSAEILLPQLLQENSNGGTLNKSQLIPQIFIHVHYDDSFRKSTVATDHQH